MKIDLMLICEDPNFGQRGHRKFWSASFQTNPRFTAGFTHDPSCSVETRWGRVNEGSIINIQCFYSWSAAHKSVPCKSEADAIKFLDKKATEKMKKGYRVVLHIVDDVNIGLLHGSAADERGFINMMTRTGT